MGWLKNNTHKTMYTHTIFAHILNFLISKLKKVKIEDFDWCASTFHLNVNMPSAPFWAWILWVWESVWVGGLRKKFWKNWKQILSPLRILTETLIKYTSASNFIICFSLKKKKNYQIYTEIQNKNNYIYSVFIN